MISKIIALEPNVVKLLCTVCVSDNNGAKIALSIIISSLILLGVVNWAWKKYFANKKQISHEK